MGRDRIYASLGSGLVINMYNTRSSFNFDRYNSSTRPADLWQQLCRSKGKHITKTIRSPKPNKVRCLFHLQMSRHHCDPCVQVIGGFMTEKKYDFHLHIEPLRILNLSWSLTQRHPHNAFSHHEELFLVLILDILYQGRILKFPALSSSRRYFGFT